MKHPQVPSERLYFDGTELKFVTSGMDLLIFRIHGARMGSTTFERRSGLWTDECSNAYANRAEDFAFYDYLKKLHSKLSKVKHGRFRLSLVDVTLIAFVARIPRQGFFGADTTRFPLLEAKLERARVRLRNATVQKLGSPIYETFKTRWKKFNAWLHYHVLNSPVHQPKRRVAQPKYRKSHQEELDQFKSWIEELIDERCESGISEEKLLWLAQETKRRARRHRFDRLSIASLLSDKPRHAETIFKYVRTRLNLEPSDLKYRYRDLATRQSAAAERIFKALNQPVALQTEPANVIPVSATPVPCPEELTSSAPVAEPSGSQYKSEDLVAVVSLFLLQIQDHYFWKAIVEDTAYSAHFYVPLARPGVPPSPYALLERATAIPDGNDSPQFWESDWLLWALSKYVPPCEIEQIVRDGWALAIQTAKSQGPWTRPLQSS